MIDPNARRLGIGGSEVGAIFGLHPFLDEFGLWARKKCQMPETEPTLRMMAGHFFEEAILKLYAYRTKSDVEYFNRTLTDPDRPWMVYSPDALVRGERRGIDAKLVAWDQRRYWGYDAGEMPEYIQLQAYYYMAAMDYPVWDIAAMIGDELRIIPVERLDAAGEQQMLTRVWEWFHRYVEGDERPEMGASKFAGQWLKTMFPHHRRPDLRFATPEEIALLTEYAEVRFESAALKEHRTSLENLLKLAIGEQEGLVWDAGKFTWRRTKDGVDVQWEAMARGLLNEYVKDGDARKALTEFYTTPKPGYRKIRFEHDDQSAEGEGE